MTKKKVVINPRPFRIESGPNVGVALKIMYDLVDPADAGYDLFDEYQLDRLKKDFIPLNEQRLKFTIEPGPMKQWSRVFVELKGST